MAFNLKKAAAWNPHYSRATSPPWNQRFDQVITELGFTNMSPGPEAFSEAVYDWQKTQPGLTADGMLGPKSWKKLEPLTRYSIDLSHSPAWLTAPTPTSSKKPSSITSVGINPKAVPAAEVKQLKTGGFIAWVDSAGGTAVAKAGEVWNGPEGKRLIVKARQWEKPVGGKLKPDGVVYYVQLTSSDMLKWFPGRVYSQSREGFLDDILLYAPLGIAGGKLAALQVLINIEMEFLLGLATCTGFGAAAHWGLFYIEHRKDFGKWRKQGAAFATALATFRIYTPKFYKKVIRPLLIDRLVDSATAPESIARTAGYVIGAFAMKKLDASGATKTLGKVKKILKKLGTVWEKVAPYVRHAGATASKFIKPATLQKELKNAINALDLSVNDTEVEEMIDEFTSNKAKVRGAIEDLQNAFA